MQTYVCLYLPVSPCHIGAEISRHDEGARALLHEASTRRGPPPSHREIKKILKGRERADVYLIGHRVTLDLRSRSFVSVGSRVGL